MPRKEYANSRLTKKGKAAQRVKEPFAPQRVIKLKIEALLQFDQKPGAEGELAAGQERPAWAVYLGLLSFNRRPSGG